MPPAGMMMMEGKWEMYRMVSGKAFKEMEIAFKRK